MTLKTAHHAKAAVHHVVTAQRVVSAVSVLNARKAMSVRMTAQKHVLIAVPKVVTRSAAKAVIRATNAEMTVAHVVTTTAKLP